MLNILAGFLVSYLLGSVPNALIFGRLLKRVDLRKMGSGNLGATNAFRVLGRGPGTLILILDIAKGTLSILLAKFVFFPSNTTLPEDVFLCLNVIATVAGHNWPVWLGFKGGKGMATSLGALLGLAIVVPRFAQVVGLEVALWAIVFVASGYVSLASIVAALTLPFFGVGFALSMTMIAFLTLLGGLALIRHKANIRRLLHGQENRFNTHSIFRKHP
jgi:glycerol-3-phosphate acyltransferase PlsY